MSDERRIVAEANEGEGRFVITIELSEPAGWLRYRRFNGDDLEAVSLEAAKFLTETAGKFAKILREHNRAPTSDEMWGGKKPRGFA